VVKQALDSIRPFAKQLFIEKDIANRQLLGATSGYPIPDMPQLIDNVIQHLLLTKWGREPSQGVQSRQPAAFV
jgi:hypothetical protein